MKITITKWAITLILFSISHLYAQSNDLKQKIVSVSEGKLQGVTLASGVNVFKGIPYAAAPVGELRWKPPVSFPKWNGVRSALEFGARPMQKSNLMYEFRSAKDSEDCLYLNIWAPKKGEVLKPVYVFIHGGSFIRGDGSQPAYDGESMAKRGIVYVSINYRLGIFGFMAHPELSKESGNGSGNYGLLDQVAALKWVQQNISAFGGDPNAITIGGESVGAHSVSAHMASPLSKGLFSKAIAESGSMLDSRAVIHSLQTSEMLGLEVSKAAEQEGIAHLRSLSAEKLLKLASRGNPRRFIPTIDGYFLKENPTDVFIKGKQANVPLLVGWNANEVPSLALFRLHKPTSENFRFAIERFHGKKSLEIAELYPAVSKQEIKAAGAEFISDYAINYATWTLADRHASLGSAPVYRYLFAHPHPGLSDYQLEKGNFFTVSIKRMINRIIKGSAFHAAEIEFALGNLAIQPNFAWTAADYQVSAQLQEYCVNFIKTGNPNGTGKTETHLAKWPEFTSGADGELMRVGVVSYAQKDSLYTRYLSWREIIEKP